jgi:hypothetical protein
VCVCVCLCIAIMVLAPYKQVSSPLLAIDRTDQTTLVKHDILVARVCLADPEHLVNMHELSLTKTTRDGVCKQISTSKKTDNYY